MMQSPSAQEVYKETRHYRILIAIAGTVYLLWWFAVEFFLPGSFNPLQSRLLVVAVIFAFLILSYLNARVRRHLRLCFFAGACLITLHYFYLFMQNGGDTNWIVGAYITVMAVGLCITSIRALTAYSVLVVVLALLIEYLVPSIRLSLLLPGILTILFVLQVGLRSRHRALKVLAASNERFQLLLNSTFEGILVHDQGRVILANDSLAEMTGYSRDELIGKDAFEFLHVEDREVVRNKIVSQSEVLYQARGVRRDGSTMDVEIRAKNFLYEKRTTRLVTIRDLSDRNLAEKERIRALTMAENVLLRDEFIAIASHELRTPIAALKLQTNLIERELRLKTESKPETQNLSGYIAVFNRQMERLIELVDTMLDVSQIAAGGLVLKKSEMDLVQVVGDVVTALRRPEIAITIVGPEHLRLVADRPRLKQVFENLIVNAMKYGNGKPVQIHLQDSGTHAEFVISDQGMGIAPDLISRIFNRFERAISARNISGLGLGLYIVRQIVDAHDGTVSVESRLGSGSTFKVSIPNGRK